MSVIEMVMEKVKRLDEAQGRQLLAWLEGRHAPAPGAHEPLGAMAMLGFARRIHPQPRTTAQWMEELRAGEQP